jgi:hypothetical protein
MKRKITILLVAAAVTLTVGAVTQVAVYRRAPSTVTMHASWQFHPQSVSQLRARAQSIVLGEVVSVRRGDDIVTQQPGEPDGVDRIPTRRVTVRVITSYKGQAAPGTQLTLFQTGGIVLPHAPEPGEAAHTNVQQLVLEGDPAYRAGEQYLLMLEPGPQETLRPVSPEGRYRHDPKSGTLTAMAHGTVPDAITASRLSALESSLRTS